MSDSFVVEANRRVVGIAIRCRGGYKFHASEPEFRALEKQTTQQSAHSIKPRLNGFLYPRSCVPAHAAPLRG